MRRDTRRRLLGIRYGRPRQPFTVTYVAQMTDGTYAKYLRTASAAGVERLGSRLAMFAPDDPRIQQVKVLDSGSWDVAESFDCFKKPWPERPAATARQLWQAYNLLTFVPPVLESEH